MRLNYYTLCISGITWSQNILAFSFSFSLIHSIFDENGNLINVGQSITIGNHVWICKDVKIMKNTNIPDGCIVAQGSIVTKKFEKENCILAGNPARVVKENIHWDSIRPNDYLKLKGNKD